jgi:hypothetical protein
MASGRRRLAIRLFKLERRRGGGGSPKMQNFKSGGFVLHARGARDFLIRFLTDWRKRGSKKKQEGNEI